MFGAYAGFRKFCDMDRENFAVHDSRDRGPAPWAETAAKVCDSK